MSIINLEDYFVNIPEGEIDLRDDRIKLKWTVKINPFLMGKFPITQEIYKKIMNENPSEFIVEKLPVENVSWNDAVKFCNKFSVLNNLEECYYFNSETEISLDATKNGIRLPTEAEWEFSCKAGNNLNRYGNLDEIAWYKDNSEKKLTK